MEKLPTISIVIPSFNKGKYIKRTLDSIFSQKYPNLEVIIQDGGSSDKTIEVLNSFQKKYPKELTFVTKKDKGQTDAINVGFTKSRGEIVSYINADDYYEGSTLWKVANYFEKNPKSNWVAGLGTVVNDSGNTIAKAVSAYKSVIQNLRLRSMLLMVNYLYQPSVFYRRNFLRQMGEFVAVDGVVLEYDMWLKMAQKEIHGNINSTISAFRLSREGFSSNKTVQILQAEEEIVKKYTTDPVILLLHKAHNLGRLWMQKFFVK